MTTVREQAETALEKSEHIAKILEGTNYSLETVKDTIMRRINLAYKAGFYDGYHQGLTDLINEER